MPVKAIIDDFNITVVNELQSNHLTPILPVALVKRREKTSQRGRVIWMYIHIAKTSTHLTVYICMIYRNMAP